MGAATKNETAEPEVREGNEDGPSSWGGPLTWPESDVETKAYPRDSSQLVWGEIPETPPPMTATTSPFSTGGFGGNSLSPFSSSTNAGFAFAAR